jgi:hypothetical protein
MNDKLWRCINEACGQSLGEVVGGEFVPAEGVGGSLLQTRGPNLVVKCPNCGTVKIWYTADPISRALHQLLDASIDLVARRAVQKIREDLSK